MSLHSAPVTKALLSPLHTMVSVPQTTSTAVPLALAEQIAAEGQLSHCASDSKGTLGLLCFEAGGPPGNGTCRWSALQ